MGFCPSDLSEVVLKSFIDFLKLSAVFPGPTSSARIKELKAWLVEKGVRDFEAVPLNCDKVEKVGSWVNFIPAQVFDI